VRPRRAASDKPEEPKPTNAEALRTREGGLEAPQGSGQGGRDVKAVRFFGVEAGLLPAFLGDPTTLLGRPIAAQPVPLVGIPGQRVGLEHVQVPGRILGQFHARLSATRAPLLNHRFLNSTGGNEVGQG
jgi:hypothetical protein